MKRRQFIKWSIAIPAIAGAIPSCNGKRRIPGTIAGANARVGHLLRDGISMQPSSTIEKKVVIVGGGVSGLSAARKLQQAGITDFLLLELDEKTGGHAQYGENEISAFPWGAHYIPIPNNDLPEYHDFLREANVITGANEQGLPIYNEAYLCFDPQERLYINGRWQDGLVPHFGLSADELAQVQRFLAQMDQFRRVKGTDDKDAFAIPVDRSSSDSVFTALDRLTMKEWMNANGYTGEHLHRYVNYCSRDDFGTPHHLVSAWAGIHYFASRKGHGANAHHSDVLTWPEGNGFLVKELQKNIRPNIRTNALVIQVLAGDKNVQIDFFDTKKNTVTRIQASQCLLAVPQYVAARLLKDEERKKLANEQLVYAPWMVANLKVRQLEERSGAPPSWDNVIHESASLGYVEATHELLEQLKPKRNLTFYYPLTNKPAAEARKLARERSQEEWAEIVMQDLEKVHPNIRSATEELNVMVWGHAMAQPLPGIISGPARSRLAESVKDRIHFAHTDLAGISIFEEAFYQGLSAANKIITQLA